MNSKNRLQNRLRGWFPKEPTHCTATETKAETKDRSLKKGDFIIYFATFFSIVFPVLLLMDFLAANLVYKTLVGAAAAGLAGLLGKFVLKLPWRNKARETREK